MCTLTVVLSRKTYNLLVQKSYIAALFLQYNFDEVLIARKAPNRSYCNPVEREREIKREKERQRERKREKERERERERERKRKRESSRNCKPRITISWANEKDNASKHENHYAQF